MPSTAPQLPTRRDSATAVSLVVIVGLLMQAGSAVAVLVIHSVGVVEALWLRTALAALILAAARPRLVRLPGKGDRLPLLALTTSLLAMNFSFYEAISRAPVGVVVAIEFLGPLGVAVAGSRRLLDGLWVVLAALGIALLARPGGTVSVGGLLFALLAAACWAAFILSAKRAVRNVGSLRATILMLVGSAVVLTPVFLATGVKVGGHTRALLLGLAVAVLSSALPYALELAAIRRVRPSTYGVLLSIEPAIAAVWGFVILSQRLAVRELFGIVAIVLAAAGAAWTSTADLPRLSRRRGGRPSS
jgi:inner membrane transporter RhtA